MICDFFLMLKDILINAWNVDIIIFIV
jgi:hypothetical protein